MTEAPPPPPPPSKPKKNSKKAKAALRASKRRKVSGVEEPEAETIGDEEAEVATQKASEDDGFGGRKWECVAITLEQYRAFMEGIRKSKHADEKILHQQIAENILPVVEKAEESLQRKAAKRQRELLALEKLATAKRSSRIAGKLEKQKEEEDAIEAEKKRKAEIVMARKEQEKIKKMEEVRSFVPILLLMTNRSRIGRRVSQLESQEYENVRCAVSYTSKSSPIWLPRTKSLKPEKDDFRNDISKQRWRSVARPLKS